MHASVTGSLLAVIFAALISCALAVNNAKQELLSPAQLLLRNATTSDTEAIAKIIDDAFYDAPWTKYAFQFRDKYPNDRYNCLCEDLRPSLVLPSVIAQVVLLPNISHPHELTPIAVAFWILPSAWPLGKAGDGAVPNLNTLMLSECKQRGLNVTRSKDFQRQLDDGREHCLDDVYARRNQLYLGLLATHPHYQRRGAGSVLVRSGVDIGKAMYHDDNVTATLIATEAGEPLYQYLGWESISNYTVKSLDVVEGRREEWRFDVMKYEL